MGSRESANVVLAAFSGQELTLPKATVLGVAENVSEPLTDRVTNREVSSANASTKPRRKRKNRVRYDKSLRGRLDRLTLDDRPGSKIGHSRHVDVAKLGCSLDREDVLREQAGDAFCSQQKPGTYRSKSDFFLDDDGLLYKRSSNGSHQLIVPATLTREVIGQNHDPAYAAHPGIKRTYNLIALRYWWPGMRKAIEGYVKSCVLC